MNSELKEFLEWTKTVRRQFEIDMDETWVTKPSIERVAIENLLIAYDQMADRLRTPSPSGGIKTAEEILSFYIEKYPDSEKYDAALQAIHAYHNQCDTAKCNSAEERFVIFDMGQPLLSERFEVHIKDITNEDFLIVIRADFFGAEEETEKYASDLIKTLNEKSN